MASSFSLGQHYESLISELVSSGRYATASEVMRDSLRLLEEREELRKVRLEALREEIQRGRDSGPPISAEDAFDRLERRYSAGT
jgi:antitoxin ParD1/3/4